MKKFIVIFYFLISCFSVFGGIDDTLTIAISKIHKKGFDTTWLCSIEPKLKFVNMYLLPLDSALEILKNCNGLLITGGQDVNPKWYNKENEISRCGEMDYRRDTLEIQLTQLAMKLKIPLLAICRGEQILNIANGGSLVIDIPSEVGKLIDHNPSKETASLHAVKLNRDSRLYSIIKKDSGMVNSFHHQSVERVAKNFKIVASSPDGVTEAIEVNDKNYFAFGVQWHPERLQVSSTFSYNIGKEFLKEARKYNNHLK